MENDANKEMFFSKYLQISNEGLPNCIKNYRNRRYIFWTVLRGKKYYIKKYVCRGIFSLKIALGINTDKVKRNTEISSALERLDILHAKPVFNRTKVYTPLCRVSVIVTEDVGESVYSYLNSYEDHIGWFQYFFQIYRKLYKNRIYSKDYNMGSLLINSDQKLYLIDFDEYLSRMMTPRFKRRLRENFVKQFEGAISDISDPSTRERFTKFCMDEMEILFRELGWPISKLPNFNQFN